MSLFQGERPQLGPILIKADGSANPITVVDKDNATVATLDATGTLTLSGTTSANGNWTIATGKTLTVTDADALTVGAVIVPQTQSFSAEILAASVDKHVFIAPRAIKITAIKEIHSVVGSTSAVVDVRKITDTSAPGAAASSTVKEFLQTAFDLTATANTTQTGTLSATAADITLAAGDKIAFNFGGTITGLVGVVTVTYKAV